MKFFGAFVIAMLGLVPITRGQVTDSAKVQIKSITIQGNEKTKPIILLRELSFDTGKVYSKSEFLHYHITRSTSNLKSLDLFNEIVFQHTSDNNESGIQQMNVTIRVIEKWYLWPIPFIEFADRNFNQWYSLDLQPYRTNFGLYIFKNNFRGMNHTIKLTLGTGYTQAFGLEIVAPYIDKKKQLGLGLDFRHKANREIQYDVEDNREQFFRDFDHVLITTQSAEVSLQYRPGLYFRQFLVAGMTRIQLADTVLSPELNQRYTHTGLSQATANVQYVFELDKQNNNLFPTQGLRVKGSLGHHQILSSDTRYQSFALESSFLQRIERGKRRFSVGISGIFKHLTEDYLPYNLSKALGYDYYVRGYEENVFLGTTFGLAKYEARFHVIPERNFHLKYMPIKAYKTMATESYLSFFIDHGFAVYRSNNQPLFGYGIGLNTLFYLDKVVRFEYSWNREGNSGLKVHFKKSF